MLSVCNPLRSLHPLLLMLAEGSFLPVLIAKHEHVQQMQRMQLLQQFNSGKLENSSV
jgi:hypothetical protein